MAGPGDGIRQPCQSEGLLQLCAESLLALLGFTHNHGVGGDTALVQIAEQGDEVGGSLDAGDAAWQAERKLSLKLRVVVAPLLPPLRGGAVFREILGGVHRVRHHGNPLLRGGG